MSEKIRQRLRRQLEWAERTGSCLVPANRNDRRALDRLGDELVQPLFRLYVRRSTWERLTPDRRALFLMRGLARQHPEWTFSGTSAAVAHGLPVTWSLLARIEAASSRASRSPAGIRLRKQPRAADDAVKVRGVRATSLVRTTFDCLAALPFPDTLAIADAALRKTGMSPGQLANAIRDQHAGERGVRRAEKIARLADGRAESGGESIARARMIELGFALPELQVWIEDPVEPGRWFRADFAWLTAGGLVLGEIDGGQKSTQPEFMQGRSAVRVLQDERLRESHLTALRAKIVRFSYDDVLNAEKFVALLDAFGVPRRSTPELPAPQYVTRHAEYVTCAGMKLLASELVAA